MKNLLKIFFSVGTQMQFSQIKIGFETSLSVAEGTLLGSSVFVSRSTRHQCYRS